MSALMPAARRLQEGALLAIVFLLPFSKAAIEIGFGLLLLGWLIERLHPASRTDTVWLSPGVRPIAWALLAFLAACAASIAGSRVPGTSLDGFVNKWLEYAMLCVMAADVARRDRAAGRLLGALSISAALVVLESVWQELFGAGLIRGLSVEVFNRMTGPYNNPADLATYLMAIVPVILMYALSHRGWRRWALNSLALALVLCLAKTEAMAGWIGFGAGIVALAWLEPRTRRAAVVLALVCVIGGVAFLWRYGHMSDATSASEIGKRDRVAMWQSALHMVRDRPVLGHGINTFMSNYLDYWVGGERQPRYAHNCYLQIAAEVGLVGLAAFLAWLSAVGLALARGIRQQAGTARIWLIGVASAFAAFTVHIGLDTDLYSVKQSALFWIVAGVGIGLARLQAEPASPIRRAAPLSMPARA